MHAVRNLIFDLDGTLIDSAPILAEILDTMLAERGSVRHVTVQDVHSFASLGGDALVSGVLAQDRGDPQRDLEDFRARYRCLPTPVGSLYDGVAEGVRDLAAHGFVLAICSNKPQRLCEKVIADLGLGAHFAVVVGSTPDCAPKPAPDLMQRTLTKLGATARECLYIGDSDVDQAVAEATGVRFAHVTYGYAAERAIVGRPEAFGRFPDLVRWIVAERAALLPGRVAA